MEKTPSINKGHYHFIGIGGIGMGALASLMMAHGQKVSGSDIRENVLTKELAQKGATIQIGHTADCIHGADFIVYSSAIKKDNPELAAAAQRKIPVLRRAELLAQLVNAQTGIAIAGAHGKTTTASMISHLFVHAGLAPTTAVGGLIHGQGGPGDLGDGKYFIVEVDESDGTFLHFSVPFCVVTNIDFEHVDYYQHLGNIVAAYGKFINKVDPKGRIVAYGEDRLLRQLLKTAPAKSLTYGFLKDNDLFAEKIVHDAYQTRFDCVFKEKTIGTIHLNIPGRHNVLNALACIGMGIVFDIDFSVISKSLAQYRGVQRRFQLKADLNDILVIDDYGHHPTEITMTLRTAQTFGKKRIITVFQPHRYTRTKYLMDEFVKSLSLSDYVILTDIYPAGEEPIAGISAKVLAEKMQEAYSVPVIYLGKEKIIPYLLRTVEPGDLVMTLGAGDITAIGDDFVQQLLKKETAYAGG